MDQDVHYLNLMYDVYQHGTVKEDRTGTGTRSKFGHQMRFDLRRGFPLLTTKYVPFKLVVAELLWFLEGSTDNNRLRELNGNDRPTIWEEWADKNGELGPIYGYQWRSWPGKIESVAAHKPAPENSRQVGADYDEAYITYQHGIDQMSNLLHMLRTNPDSRRLIVSAWNVADIDSMKLPPCHAFFQFNTVLMTIEEREDYYRSGKCGEVKWTGVVIGNEQDRHARMDSKGVPRRYLDCQLYQRSADIFLGVPFNIASYSLLLAMVADQVNMVPREFIWTGGDCHIYSNHIEQVETQLQRKPYSAPRLVIKNRPLSLFAYKVDDFELESYVYHPAISAPVAV